MSQFVTLPPMEKVAWLFLHATGCRLEIDASWTSWNELTPESYVWLTPYIRPCHQTILHETMTGLHSTPISLLRQLLRPYDYRIESGLGYWTLRHGKPEKGVRIKKTPTRIVWNEPSPTAESKKE